MMPGNVDDAGEGPNETTPLSETPPPTLPTTAIGRMSLYYRELHRLLDSKTTSVNSRQLGDLLGVSPAVVRRDLSALKATGRRGVGYSVPKLIESIGAMLGSGMRWKVVLVGVGSLGDALLRYRGFERLGFELVGAFDLSPRKIGTKTGGVIVSDAAQMPEMLLKLRPDLAILAVPVEQALEVAVTLVESGVTGILNFAPITLQLPGAVAIVNVDLASELQRLAFSVQQTPPSTRPE